MTFFPQRRTTLILAALSALALTDACTPDALNPDSPTSQTSEARAKKDGQRYKRKEIDEFIETHLTTPGMPKAGSENRITLPYWDWAVAPDEMIHSALLESDEPLTVGYQIPGYDFTDLTKIDLKEQGWRDVRQKLLDIAFNEEKAYNKELTKPEDLVVYRETGLPNFELNISRLSTLQKLRASGLIRYFIPTGYQHGGALYPNASEGQAKARAGMNDEGYGCGQNEVPAPVGTNALAYTSMTQPYPNNARVPWNLIAHRMHFAWGNGATGAGKTLAFIDTGLSDEQTRMLPGVTGFNGGYSGSRLQTRLSTLPKKIGTGVETTHDPCGHGTCVASIGTAPMNGPTMIGTAYLASLVSVRASADRFMNTAREVRGVHDAFTAVSLMMDVRVISLSLSTLINVPLSTGQTTFTTYYQHLTDAIVLAHQRDKLIIGTAGGFDPDNVPGWAAKYFKIRGITNLLNMTLFPATLPEVVAVTGVKMIPSPSQFGPLSDIALYQNRPLTTCHDCLYSDKVDFAVINQFATRSGVQALTRTAGDDPTVFGNGGSSATATFAGMAVALWSKFPGYTRDQVVNRLKASASHVNNRQTNVGWGVVNMELAASRF